MPVHIVGAATCAAVAGRHCSKPRRHRRRRDTATDGQANLQWPSRLLKVLWWLLLPLHLLQLVLLMEVLQHMFLLQHMRR